MKPSVSGYFAISVADCHDSLLGDSYHFSGMKGEEERDERRERGGRGGREEGERERGEKERGAAGGVAERGKKGRCINVLLDPQDSVLAICFILARNEGIPLVYHSLLEDKRIHLPLLPSLSLSSPPSPLSPLSPPSPPPPSHPV